MKLSTLLFFLIVSSLTYASENHDVNKQALPCMNIPHTDEVTECMINLSKEKEMEYIKEYNEYLKVINVGYEGGYNNKLMPEWVAKAKLSWDRYTEDECLSESSNYEEGSYSFNDVYHSCLIDHYDKRIAYYRKMHLKMSINDE